MQLKRNILIAVLLIAALIMSFCRTVTGKDFFLLVYFVFTGVSLLLYLSKIKIPKQLPFYFAFTVLFFFVVPTITDIEQTVTFHLYIFISFLSTFIIAYLVYKNPYRIKFAFTVFILFFTFFFYNVYSIGIFNPAGYNDILHNGSRNIVAAFILFITVFLISVHYQERLQTPVLYLIIPFLSCVILYGRTGVALSFILLIFFTYNRFNIYYKVLLLTISSLIIAYFLNDLTLIVTKYTNFNTGLETPRTDMINEYINDLTFKELVFGQSFSDCCTTIMQFGENPHNSFIKGHSRYGIAHTMFFMFVFIRIALKNKSLFILSMVLLIKYSTDTIGLFSSLDFILFYLFLLTYLDRPSLKQPMSQNIVV